MSKQDVIAYYAQFGAREWDRLMWPEGQLEFAITQDAFDRYLPENARILDIGGGVGRWTVWLASNGHKVTLADLSPNLLEIARQKIDEYGVKNNIEKVVHADACDLSLWANDSFDAVLCLGPLYHLTEPDLRAMTARELYRVLKPGGLVFAAFMPVYGFLRRVLTRKDERHYLGDEDFMNRLINKGVFVNDIPGRFSSGYGIKPDRVAPFMRQYGFAQVELLSDSGFAGSHAQQIAELATENPEAHRRLMQVVIESASDPSNLGSSVHMLYIGRKAELDKP